MGNQQTSSTISSFSFDTLILDSVLNEVPTDGLSLSVQKVKNIKFNDFGVLADKIFEKGITNHYCSSKYAELALKLCEEIPPDGFVTTGGASVDWNLQDYLNRKAHYYFEVLHSCIENGRPLTNDRLYGISVFIGNLYNFDLISSERIYLWILNDAYPLATEVRKHILFTIKEKVLQTTENQDEVCSDPFVWELVDWLGKEGIIKPKLVTKPKPKIPNEVQIIQNEPSSSSSSSSLTTAPKSNVNPQLSIPKSFEQYLKSIKAPPVKAFDIQLFKTCSENDRRECAKNILRYALSDPMLAQKYARLALSILQLQMKSTTTKKSFINHLSDACEKQLELYKDIPNINWIEMENFGTFLAELYNLEVLRIFIMNTWLENTRTIAEENDLAIKMLFKVVKIVDQKMRFKDPRTLRIYLNHFEKYRATKRVPIAYMSWLQGALSAPKPRDRSSSAVSSTSESSRSSRASTSTQSTGAIKKQQVVAEITDTTKICEEFAGCLNEFRATRSCNYTVNLETASDAAIRGCALLLIEHSLLNEAHIAMFVHVTKFIILKQIKKEDRLKVFTANFTLYIYAEMNKCLKTEDPNSSNWIQVAKVGKFICELYKQEIIEGTVVKAWLSKLEFTATIGSEEAAREFYTTLGKVGEKLKNELPQEYEQFRKFSNRERPKEPTTSMEITNTSTEKMQLLWSNEMRDFNYFINNLSTTPTGKLTSVIENIKTDDRQQMEMLVQVYFEAFKKHNGNPVYAYLARKLHEEVFKSSKISFRNLLIALAIKEFNTVFCDGRGSLKTTKEKQAAECHAKCIGELYSIGWLDESILNACLDKLAEKNLETPNNLQVFRNFINNISMDIVENGHGACAQKFYKILQEKRSKYPEAFNQFVCDDAIDILRNIWNLSKLRNAHNINEVSFEEILRKLTIKNFAMSSSRINLSSIGSQEDLNAIVKVLFQACLTHPDNVYMYVKFLDEIKEKKLQLVDGRVSSICDAFINHSKHEFMEYAPNFELKLLPNIMTVLSIQSELYNTCLSSFVDMKFCLDIFFQQNSFNDDKIDCLYFFMHKIGPKADEDKKEIMDEYFDKFDQADMTTEYVSQQVKALKKLREKRWMSDDEFIEFSSVDDEKIEEFLKNIKDTEVSSKCNILKQHVLASEININNFLHVLFKCNLEDENIALKSANFCKLLVAGESNEMKQKFIENLNHFMKCRSQTFSAVAKDVNEKLRQKLVNIILLNGHLYSENIIDNSTIQQWIVPSFTSHLNLSEMSKLCMLVSTKIDESENIQLKARLMNLESAIQEKLMITCHSTKVDLNFLA